MIRAAATLLLCLSATISANIAAAAAEPPAWVKESNEHAKIALDVVVKFSPEGASHLGVEGYDDRILDLKPKVFERSQKASKDAAKELRARLAKATDPAVKQDLEILIQAAEDNYNSAQLRRDQLVPYFAMPRVVFGGVRALLDPRVSKERQALAVTRMKRYAGLVDGEKPITELARDRIEERLKDKKLARPFKGQIEQDLSDSPRLVAGVRDLFAKSGLDGWQDAIAAYEKQVGEYDKWVRETLLPQARSDHRLPPAVYADNLKQFGLDVTPEQLIPRALISFSEIQSEMRTLAPLVAKEKKIKSTDYRDVIRTLKEKQITGEAILPLYNKRLDAIEAMIRREKIVTLPDRKAQIRLASEAESAMSPAPNMRPPRMIGNTGEYGEFVLPLIVPGREGKASLKMDDFTHDASTWTLTAHEARPGHELQFSAMVEKGISTARAVFAFNSVNIEGWGLYAEAEMKPYLPLEGQLVSLQLRLQRAARAFLDPMVNLGQLTPEQVKDFLMKEVVLSEGMAQQEVDRYTFRSPGQATAYFYGYQRLLETRQRAELALRERFDRQAFNDFVLSQGLLPPTLLEKAVMEEFVPSRRKV
jgi:uncharacterized protein (DUF885 family)